MAPPDNGRLGEGSMITTPQATIKEREFRVAADEGMQKDCHVEFTPDSTQKFKIEVQNRTFKEPEAQQKNRDNRCTLKWEPKGS